jgi:putative ATP-dependent endonuclease of OLD family
MSQSHRGQALQQKHLYPRAACGAFPELGDYSCPICATCLINRADLFMLLSMSDVRPLIRKLSIERFRGIQSLIWYPAPGVNVILGGGDAGKSTILDSISLLLHPSNSVTLAEADYWRREVDKEFCIEAVMTIPESCGLHSQAKNAWPWRWDGKDAVLPEMDAEGSTSTGEAVFRVRARGTADFDLQFEVRQPSDELDHFSVAVRRAIGLVRLASDDRNDRDLRLIQGSALDRLLSDRTLRSRLGKLLGTSDVKAELEDKAKDRLVELDTAFVEKSLPSGLGLGLSGGQGFSINALIGLTATKENVELPLAVWGAGTRRLAALEVAAIHHGDYPITVVDEVERGLEPYRQRVLVEELEANGSQVFVTTHSSAVLRALDTSTLWYMDASGNVGALPKVAAAHEKRDPELFLSRFAVVAEGITEVGFVTRLLTKAIGDDLTRRGVRVSDAGGNESALLLLEGLSKSGLRFAGFADDEGTFPGKWANLKTGMKDRLFRWQKGCLEENLIGLLRLDQLESFIEDPDGEETGSRYRTLADRLGIADKSFAAILAAAPNIRQLMVETATGTVPKSKEGADKSEKTALKKHAQCWFKNPRGGRELADKVFALGLWPKIQPDVMVFLNAIRGELSLGPIEDLPQ